MLSQFDSNVQLILFVIIGAILVIAWIYGLERFDDRFLDNFIYLLGYMVIGFIILIFLLSDFIT
jgi:hypothetical protein